MRKKRVEHRAQGEQERKWAELRTHTRKISLLPMVGLRPILLNSGSLVRDGDRETLTFSRYKVGLPGCKSAGVCVCVGGGV